MEPQPGWDSALGLRIEELSATRVVGYVDIDERHHQGYGIVHGGVWASVVESIGTGEVVPINSPLTKMKN